MYTFLVRGNSINLTGEKIATNETLFLEKKKERGGVFEFENYCLIEAAKKVPTSSVLMSIEPLSKGLR